MVKREIGSFHGAKAATAERLMRRKNGATVDEIWERAGYKRKPYLSDLQYVAMRAKMKLATMKRPRGQVRYILREGVG